MILHKSQIKDWIGINSEKWSTRLYDIVVK